jgi:cytochrome c-type biogenesis protein CcmE
MSQKKNQKMIYLLALLFLGGGIGYLLFSGLSQNSVYFLNVSEALAMETDQLDQARLFGQVDPKGIEHDPSALGVSFLLRDKENPGQMLRVTYRGAVPDTFKPEVEVIVEGGFDPTGTVFTAKTLLTKCPSKYQQDEQGDMRPPQ